MTTFEGLIYGIVNGITQFFPIGAQAHNILVPAISGLSPPLGAAAGAFVAGSFLAVLFYFRHDWASMISSFLQIILFRRYPASLDERLPIFIILAMLPPIVGWYYFHDKLLEACSDPLWVAGSLAVFGGVLWLSDHFSRKSKGMYDWNWIDSLFVGFAQALSLIPGFGLTAGGLSAALFRNYQRDSAAKFTLFLEMPILACQAAYLLRDTHFQIHMPPGDNLSWLTFSVALVVSFLTSLLTIGGFMKHFQKHGVRSYVIYRFMVGLGALAWLKYKGGT